MAKKSLRDQNEKAFNFTDDYGDSRLTVTKSPDGKRVCLCDATGGMVWDIPPRMAKAIALHMLKLADA